VRCSWQRLERPQISHEFLGLGVSLSSLGLATGWFGLGLPWPRCGFHAITGFPCLTCGATRSTIQFFHGHFLAALRWNPLVFVALCAVILFALYATVVLVGQTKRLRIVDWTAAERRAARIAVISLLALNWIYLLAHRDRF